MLAKVASLRMQLSLLLSLQLACRSEALAPIALALPEVRKAMLFQEWDDEPAPVVLDPQTAVPIHADARPLVSFTGQHAPALAAWGPFVYIATTTHLVQLGAGYGYSVPGRLYRSVQWHADDAPANRQPWLAVVSEVLYCGWTDGGDIVMRSLASLEVLGTTRWAAPDPDANDVVKVVSDGRCLVRVTLVGVSSSKDAAEPSASVGAPTLCATGPVGAHPHSPDEFCRIDTIVPRAQAAALTILARDAA